MNDLEEIRKQKLEALQRAAAEQDFIKQQLEGVKKPVLQRFLTKKARERLAIVKVANPQLAEQVEVALVEAAHTGQIQEQIDEDKLKEILSRATPKRNFRIIH